MLLCCSVEIYLSSCKTLVEGLGQADKQAYLGRAATANNPKELETESDLYHEPLDLAIDHKLCGCVLRNVAVQSLVS